MNVAVKPENAIAVDEAYALPLEKVNPARTDRFQNDTIWPVFARLRREDPVHFTPESEYGPYWSVTRWKDIMAADTNQLCRGWMNAPRRTASAENSLTRAWPRSPRKVRYGICTGPV